MALTGSADTDASGAHMTLGSQALDYSQDPATQRGVREQEARELAEVRGGGSPDAPASATVTSTPTVIAAPAAADADEPTRRPVTTPQIVGGILIAVIIVAAALWYVPRIVRADGEDRDLEGCLSIPGYVAYVTRKEKVWVVAQNRVGKKFKVAGAGFLGRAFQHELDHLQGKLYVDYLSSPDELIPVGRGGMDDEEDQEK